jgi:DNA helicase-2/ATP-dependent DNA helicase PcrA
LKDLLKSNISSLNDSQKKAALKIDGPTIIIAGAGSGKTRVLTFRIAYLISQGIDPFSILSLTFTNKAAKEMKTRVGELVNENESRNIWMGTFHSVFAKILRIESDKLGYSSSFTIYDTQDSDRLISSIIKEMGLSKDSYKPKQIRNRISTLKNSLITVESYESDFELKEYDEIARRPLFGKIYLEYTKRCFKSNSMDFDDLLLKTNELLNKFPEILAKYQDRFRFILVDEYQDTNHSQYLIVKMLADKYQNICVVGDDSQSIYSFRGANINNILNFQKDYEEVEVFKLEQNYRSTKNIVSAANSLINHNKFKLDKTIWTKNEEGEKVIIKKCFSDNDEGKYIARNILQTVHKNKTKYSSFAVLYRTNAQSRIIEESFRKNNIPYKIFGGLSFYQRKEIKDILAYLRLVTNSNDEESLKRIINFPPRGIGNTTIDKLVIASKTYDLSIYDLIVDKIDVLKINSGTRSKILDFVNMIEGFKTMTKTYDAFELASQVTKRIGIVKFYENEGTAEGINRIQNIEELLNGVKNFIDEKNKLSEPVLLVNFLEEVAMATDFEVEDESLIESVSLMTVHLSKGLEFPYVYIIGMEENLFPSSMSLDSREGLEEERRLFYVALTRAEKRANLTFTNNRYRWGKIIESEESRFLDELDSTFIKFDYQNYNEVDLSYTSKKINFNSINNKFRKLQNFKNIDNETKSNPLTKIKKFRVNMIVSHPIFGKGVIKGMIGESQDARAKVLFNESGEKNLLLKYANLKIIDDEV